MWRPGAAETLVAVIVTIHRVGPDRYALDGAEMSSANALEHLAGLPEPVSLKRSTLPDTDPVVTGWARVCRRRAQQRDQRRDAGYARNPRQPGVPDLRTAQVRPNGSL
jgi:hypothetical protein